MYNHLCWNSSKINKKVVRHFILLKNKKTCIKLRIHKFLLGLFIVVNHCHSKHIHICKRNCFIADMILGSHENLLLKPENVKPDDHNCPSKLNPPTPPL